MKRPLKILHVITGLQLGGAEALLCRLIQASDPSRLVHGVISLQDRGVLADALERNGTPIDTLDLHHPVKALMGPWRAIRRGRAFTPDVVHGWMYHGNFAAELMSLLGVRAPVVLALHSGTLDPDLTKRATIAVARAGAWLARRAACVVSCSESGARFHARIGYPASKLIVIPNGFDLDLFRPDPSARAGLRQELGLPRGTPLIGMVGRFAAVKNHHLFLEAARNLLARSRARPSPHFLLCGSGVEPHNTLLLDWISRLELSPYVHLLGRRDDMPRIYSSLDLLASCSLSEAFPLAPGEAMACGTPCAVSDVGDSALLVGDTGRIVTPGSASELAGALMELLLLPPEQRETLAAQARHRIEDRFSLSSMMQRYEELYREVSALAEPDP